MKIVIGYPPLIDEIDAAFGSRKVRGVLYCWGDTIFNPDNYPVPPDLIAHETVHSRQQGKDIEGWWRRYIAEPEFRLAQELEAHRVEYAFMFAKFPNPAKRRANLSRIAVRLCSPLYGKLLTLSEAKRAIST